MVEWGTRFIGTETIVTDLRQDMKSAPIVYEFWFITPIDIPDWLEAKLLDALKWLAGELKKHFGVPFEVIWWKVEGRNIWIQIRKHSPAITLAAVIAVIIGIIAILALINVAVHQVKEIHPTAQIAGAGALALIVLLIILLLLRRRR